MIYKKYMEEVKDPFDVYLRIRDFVPSWRIFWNRRKERFEVHDIESGEWYTLVSVLPFDAIDQRTVDYLRKNRRCHFGKIMRDIEENNADLVRRQMLQREDALEYCLRKNTGGKDIGNFG